MSAAGGLAEQRLGLFNFLEANRRRKFLPVDGEFDQPLAIRFLITREKMGIRQKGPGLGERLTDSNAGALGSWVAGDDRRPIILD
jgi:hypothetical protein